MSGVRLTARVWWSCPQCGGYGDVTAQDVSPDEFVGDLAPAHTCRAGGAS